MVDYECKVYYILLVLHSSSHSPLAMLWGLAKLIGGRALSGHRQSWWADGVPVILRWCPGHILMVSRSCCDGAPVML